MDELLPHIVGTVIGAVGAYVAIRENIAVLITKITNLEHRVSRLEALADKRID